MEPIAAERAVTAERPRGTARGSVIGFMSGNQQDPDIMCELFILAPTDLVDDHEIPDRPRRRLARN